MLRFLNSDVVEPQVQCTLRHSEGNFHRKKHISDTTEFFRPMQTEMLHKDAMELEKLIDERNCLEEQFAIRWALSLCNDELARNRETDELPMSPL